MYCQHYCIIDSYLLSDSRIEVAITNSNAVIVSDQSLQYKLTKKCDSR